MTKQFRIILLAALSVLWICLGFTENITLRYDESALFDIKSPIGRHLMIDIVFPVDLQISPGAGDILLTPHRYPDHWNRSFQDVFT